VVLLLFYHFFKKFLGNVIAKIKNSANMGMYEFGEIHTESTLSRADSL